MSACYYYIIALRISGETVRIIKFVADIHPMIKPCIILKENTHSRYLQGTDHACNGSIDHRSMHILHDDLPPT